MKRMWASQAHEQRHWRAGKTTVAGVDEAGRGALAGPIVAAAVVMPMRYRLRVADSKTLSPKQRERLFVTITANAIAWHVALVEANMIDSDGIDAANELSVRNAVAGLGFAPDYIYADKVRLTMVPDRWETVVDGDRIISAVAAASILAKVARDSIMLAHHQQLPRWGFNQHKGYGTTLHFENIKQHGLSPIHRRTFVSHH